MYFWVLTHNLNCHIHSLQKSIVLSFFLEKDSVLHEFVRQVDVPWGPLFKERPHFQQPGQGPHTNDEYTHESVRNDLMNLMEKVETVINGGECS